MSYAALIGGGIGAGSSLLGGLISQGGNQSAGARMGAATGEAVGNVNEQIRQERSYLSPWAQVGESALNQLAGLYGLGHLDSTPTGAAINGTNWQGDQTTAASKFQTSPGYQFRLQQGVNALQRSGVARGMQMSGAQQKALSDYGQGTASGEYGNYVNQLQALNGQGLGAVESGNQTAAALTGVGVNALMGGTAQQAGYDVGGANAFASGLVGAGNSIASGAMGYYGSGGFGRSGGLGDAGALVPGGINGNGTGGYSYAPRAIA